MITRIAPSPTGAFHIGTARTAYLNYLYAKTNNGLFILRIDDTDVERNKEEYTNIIIDSLDWLGIHPDKIFYQSKRVGLYQEEARGLLAKNKAIELDNGAIALRCPYDLPRAFMDTISGSIPITDTNREQIDNRLILLRGGEHKGSPTYQFASTIDDYFMSIGNVIRGVDHITNTPKQIAIWTAMNEVYSSVNCPKPLPLFTHVGLINKDKKKLSKRDSAASLLWYRDNGYKPEVILNFILFMGWAHKDANFSKTYPLVSKELAIRVFMDGHMKNSTANYDDAKLEWLKKKY